MSFGAWLFSGDTVTFGRALDYIGREWRHQLLRSDGELHAGKLHGQSVRIQRLHGNDQLQRSHVERRNLLGESAERHRPQRRSRLLGRDSGVGCQGQGCPSEASQNSVGSIPSEAFTILGNGTTTTTCYFDCPPQCVSSGENFDIIHSFTSEEGSPDAGLAFDRAGRVYGATGSGGSAGLGLAYQIAPQGQSWTLNPLYSFLGGTNGQNPLPGIIGPDDALYGSAAGGNDCQDGQPCGLIYRMTPAPTACLTALCSWIETVLYNFTNAGGYDPNSNLVYDRAGNLYGIALYGGVNGQGTVYELTPSAGSWTQTVLHDFTGGSDGGQPASLLLGQDGNLYGTTYAGGSSGGAGVLFQLVPSGGSWTENVIASYAPCSDPYSGCPGARLIQESLGEFYGLNQYNMYICRDGNCYWYTLGQIFKVSPSKDGWQITVLDDTYDELCGGTWCYEPGGAAFNGLAIDAAGQLYADLGTEEYCCQFGYVFKWTGVNQEQQLVWFAGDDFRDVELGPNGDLYGTTGSCGGSPGTVWQLSP